MGLVVVTNSVVADYSGHAHAAVTLHPRLMSSWWEARKRSCYHPITRCVAHRNKQGGVVFDFVTDIHPYLWPEQKVSGSSGHYAVKVALETFKASKVVLAGVPMTHEGAHYYTTDLWNPAMFLPAWENTYDRLKGVVRSMSGWTAEKFGKPTLKWATGE